MRLRFLPILLIASLAAGCGHTEAPAPVSSVAAPLPTFVTAVVPLVERHCLECHGGGRARGGVTLPLHDSTASADLALWRRAADSVRAGTMPPLGRTRPTPTEVDAFSAWLNAARTDASCGVPGRVALRRLNRGEYDRSIRALTGLDLHPADDFPADDLGYGFDTVGDVLAVPPLLTEKYLTAAEDIIDRLWQTPSARDRILNPPPDPVPLTRREWRAPVREQARKVVRLSAEDAPAPTATDVELDRAYRILAAFADRAYRRPALHDELTRLLRFVEAAQRDGDGWEAGVKLALTAVLASPHFLFKVEIERGPGAQPLGPFELATRLSYFLWSAPPDDELFRLALAGSLNEPATLAAQARRMLRDPKSAALAEEFAPQWLQTRGLTNWRPDPARFPEVDDALRRAMMRESELFFDRIVREDRSILDFLDADWTVVNGRLARHYGIAGVEGEAFRRVSLAGTGRGGVLTQAAILAATSNATRTSPVKRGRWVLENLLNAPVPLPPPGVDDLPASATPTTIRARLDMHRSRAECASCHARMDPLGFALEQFDATGARRDRDEGQPIDTAGVLPDGTALAGPEDLRRVLRDRADNFRGCLVEKLMIYALGREPTATDACAVAEILTQLRRQDDCFSALAIAIVQSEPFRLRQTPGGGP